MKMKTRVGLCALVVLLANTAFGYRSVTCTDPSTSTVQNGVCCSGTSWTCGATSCTKTRANNTTYTVESVNTCRADKGACGSTSWTCKFS